MYYKDENNGLYVDPIVSNHIGLISIDEVEFYALANPVKTPEQIKSEMIAHFKSLYLKVVQDKLDELDYDSLATVKLWEGDATFGAEATKILAWYKSIIAYNYALLGSVQSGAEIPTDEEYVTGIPVYA